MKIGTTDVIRLYKQEYRPSSNPGGFAPPEAEDNPEGKACPLNAYITWNGNYYRCVQTEVIDMNNGNVMHKRVTITFLANGGSGGSSQVRTYQAEQITQPGSPTWSGYTFNGWYTAASGGTILTFPSTTPLNDTMYFAQWTSSQAQTTMPTLFTNLTKPPLISVQVRAKNNDNSGSAEIKYDTFNPPTTVRGASIAYNAYTGWVSMGQPGMGGVVYATAQVSGELKSAVISLYLD